MRLWENSRVVPHNKDYSIFVFIVGSYLGKLAFSALCYLQDYPNIELFIASTHQASLSSKLVATPTGGRMIGYLAGSGRLKTEDNIFKSLEANQNPHNKVHAGRCSQVLACAGECS